MPFSFNGNVMNTGLITSTCRMGVASKSPVWLTVEAHPCYVGDLPPRAFDALNRSNIAVMNWRGQAVLERDREAAFPCSVPLIC